MNSADFYKEYALQRLEKICQPYEFKDARAAFDGDVEAAICLSIALSNDKRGFVAAAMWRSKVPVGAFRAYLGLAWDHDHRWVIDAAQTRRRLASMFRYAAFPLPAEMPDIVTVWRGTSKLSVRESQRGYSWTTDKDTACWFAMRFADANGSPLVLTANVAKSDIALFHNERAESEVVLFKPPAAAIDGDETDWRAGFQRIQDARARLGGVPKPAE